MAVKNKGTLIKEARTAKKLSQESLAAAIDGLSGSDIGKAERGEKELTQTQLKAIAKVLGVTQKSLLEAPSGGAAATAAAKKPAASAAKKPTAAAAKKTSTAATTAAKKPAASAAKKTTTAAAKKTAAASTAKKATTAKKAATEEYSTTEKKLIELYREASSENKKLATRILKGEKMELGDILSAMMASGAIGEEGLLGSLMGKIPGLGK